jgi:hypothetical protein
MVRLRNPYGRGELTIADEVADRYLAQGWVRVDEPAAKPAKQAQPPPATPAAGPPPEGDTGEPPAPPKGNASRAEWAAYADAAGITYPADATRDEIRDAVTAT